MTVTESVLNSPRARELEETIAMTETDEMTAETIAVMITTVVVMMITEDQTVAMTAVTIAVMTAEANMTMIDMIVATTMTEEITREETTMKDETETTVEVARTDPAELANVSLSSLSISTRLPSRIFLRVCLGRI
jgi:hypothetical protein